MSVILAPGFSFAIVVLAVSPAAKFRQAIVTWAFFRTRARAVSNPVVNVFIAIGAERQNTYPLIAASNEHTFSLEIHSFEHLKCGGIFAGKWRSLGRHSGYFS